MAGKRPEINPLDVEQFAALIDDMPRFRFILSMLALCAAPPASASQPFPKFQPNPAIWKLVDEDTEIYMFGTIHALPKALNWRSEALNAVIAKADELVVESLDTGDILGPAVQSAMLAALDRKALVDRIDPKNRQTLIDIVAANGLSMDYLDLIPTWMVTFVIETDASEEQGASREYGVETVLETVFRKAKKPIRAIEDANSVDAALTAMSEQDQLIALNGMLTEIRTAEPESLVPTKETETHPYDGAIEWAKGNVEKIATDLTPEVLGTAYYKILLIDRNTAWAGWLQERMKKPGKILLAVGAGHLSGPESVQNMLIKKGLKVERIH